jgi:hypothetical protein
MMCIMLIGSCKIPLLQEDPTIGALYIVRLCLVNFVVMCCLDKDEHERIKFVIIYKG